MTFHKCIEPYTRGASVPTAVKSSTRLAKLKELPGGLQLWLATGKIAGIFLVIALIYTFAAGAYKNTQLRQQQQLDETISALTNENIALLAQRGMMIRTLHGKPGHEEFVAVNDTVSEHVIKIKRKVQ